MEIYVDRNKGASHKVFLFCHEKGNKGKYLV